MKKIRLYILVLISFFIINSCGKTNEKTEYVRKAALNEETIVVGIYKTTGFEYTNIKYIAEALKIDGGIVYVTLTDADVLKTKLENIDVLIFPALKNGQVIDKLDKEISDILKKFISKKGAIGFTNECCLLLKNLKSQSLDIIDVSINESIKTEFYSGLINFELSDEGKKIFPELADKENLLIGINGRPELQILDTSNIVIVGNRTSDPGSPLFFTTKFGNGNIFITNTQPEITPGMRWMIPRMVRWTYNKDFVFYDSNVFRPNLFSKEVKLDADVQNKLEELLNQLEVGKKSEIISAMDELQELYPIIAADKVRSLLIEKNDVIKLRAAKYLVDIEYTLAIDDLKKLIKRERSKKNREQLESFKIELENMLEQN
ncbi:MAG: hypothetical protein PF485_05790 [Bacteroidales bacterium]|jgi:hypothetical protein|nr:hypothetical protein [Bacteroidales bacterium]